MTNKTITLSRELADLCYRALNGGDNQLTGMEHGRAFRELRAALTSQHVVCSAGILCQNRECKECGGNGSYIPPLADPVPPVGGEVEVRTFYAREIDLDNGFVECIAAADHRAHVTRLQAEVEHWRNRSAQWKERVAELTNEGNALQSELTKARELLTEAPRGVPGFGDWTRRLIGFLQANQSAPADDSYPPCDYCGTVPDYHPWHGLGMIKGQESPHIHACNDCRGKLPAPADKGQGEPVDIQFPSEDELIANGLGYPIGKEDAIKLHFAGFRSGVITILEAWDAIGHDIGCNPSKDELLDSLRNMAAICDAHGNDMPAEQRAPVAVVVPSRRSWSGIASWKQRAEVNAWNACLDEVARLNPIKQ